MFYRKIILPRINYFPFLISRIILEILNSATFFKFKHFKKQKSIICIEAGMKGWELIDYKELILSAIDYIGEDSVIKIEIDKSKNYIDQVKKAIKINRPTHYVYDARTGDQNWIKGLIESFRIAIIYQINGIIPICILTDLPVRTWRTQCGVVSAKNGVVVSLMSPKDISPIFPHNRIIGPLTMPFSTKTFKMLKTLIESKNPKSTANIVFTGSLYEPRTSILNAINDGLSKKGLKIDIKARDLGAKRFSDEQYWSNLVNASIVITTSSQISSNQTDWAHLPHLIYRYIEVPASGSLLIAPVVPSIERYFKEDEHFISYNSVEEAVNKIEFYLNNNKEREIIAKRGYLKAQSLIYSNVFWMNIDIALGKHSIL